MEKHGLPAEPDLCEEGDWTPESGAAAMDVLIERVRDLDAVVVANDRMALGAMHVLRGRGIRIPDDLAITGFDDIEEAAWFAPPLTSVEQPLAEMGRQAVQRLRGEFEGTESAPTAIHLRAELMIRESTIGSGKGSSHRDGAAGD